MNAFLPKVYDETTHRLVLGLEPVDAARRSVVAQPLDVVLDGVPAPLPRGRRRAGWLAFDVRSVPPRLLDARPRITRHGSCRYALLYRPTSQDHVDVRLLDPERRFVPRFLRLPIVKKTDDPDKFPYTHRVRRPALFPGAAYDVSEIITGLRGRVLRAVNPDVPLRWARIEARLPTGFLVGRAHGDDRGEFLLLLGLLAPVGAPPAGDLVSPFKVRLTVFGREPAPVPPSPELPALDPLWDLPREDAPAPGLADDVTPGEKLPGGFVSKPNNDPALDFTEVDFVLGKVISERDGIGPFVFS